MVRDRHGFLQLVDPESLTPDERSAYFAWVTYESARVIFAHLDEKALRALAFHPVSAQLVWPWPGEGDPVLRWVDLRQPIDASET